MPSYDYKNLPIGTLYNFVKKGRVNTSPDYQRGIVWNDSKQKALIQTLLHGFPIPSINFVEDNDAALQQFECMDGKNRLESIVKYMNDDLVVNGGRFSQLADDLQDDFRAINVQVCVFKSLSYDERRRYFRSIQEGVALNQTEIVWSYNDLPLVSELRKIREQKEVFKTIELLWETNRYSDLTLLCNLASMVMAKDITKDCAGHSTALTNWVKKSKDIPQNYILISRFVKKVIMNLGENLKDVRPNSKARPMVVLDLARVLIHRNCTSFAEEKVKLFVSELNEYMAHDEEPTIPDIKKYAEAVQVGDSSKMWGKRIIETRFNLLKNIV